MANLPIRAFQISLLAALLFANGAPAQEKEANVIAVGREPVAVAVNHISNQAFVLNKGSQDLVVIDLANRVAISKYLVGGIPEWVALNPRNNMLVVASTNAEVSIIDHAMGQIVATIPAGRAPSRVAIDTEKNRALVTNFNGGNMAVIDLEGLKVVDTVALGKGPQGIGVLEGKRRAIVACQYDMSVVQVNLENNSIEQKLVIGRLLGDLAVNPRTGMAVIAGSTGAGLLSIYDPAKNVVVSTIPVGAGPLSVAIYARKNVAVVTEYAAGTVSLIDLGKNSVIKSIAVPKGPSAVAVNADSGLAVVACRLAGSVVILDLEEILSKLIVE